MGVEADDGVCNDVPFHWTTIVGEFVRMRKSMVPTAAAVLFVCAACNTGSSDAKPTTESNNAASAQNTSTAQTNDPQNLAGGATEAKPKLQSPAKERYPMDGIKTIADECVRPKVVLATVPQSLGKDYPWSIARQALLANQQFRVISGYRPDVLGQISLASWEYGEVSYALVATCADGTTCNRLASMYKAVVRSSDPQVVCAQRIRGMSRNPVGTFAWEEDPRANLPKDGDLVASCARLSACMLTADPSTPGDPYLECQKAPANFKTDCAKRYPCSEVLACLGK